ncbi:MAG: exonuclease subunit SbcD [Saprospiraceae bacterium]|nr:exonuclease subunit SbcD [Saprospiraceae bacterium]
MKILHTADWHLGKRLENFSRHEEQVAVLDEICSIADREDVDAVVIAGDIFDVFNPPNESAELFFKTCKRLSNNGLRAVIAIAGNHDSPERIEVPDVLARESGIVFLGFPTTVVQPFSLSTGLCLIKSDAGFIELKLPRCAYPLRLFLTPYANEYRLRQYLNIENSEEELRQKLTEQWYNLAQKYADTEGVNIAVAHLFVAELKGKLPEEPEEEKPIHVGNASVIYNDCFPFEFQYVAMGHLHRQQEISSSPCPVVYSGSPLAYSFHEENQDKYVMLIEAKPNENVDYQRIKLTKNKKLLRGRFETVDEVLSWVAQVPDDLLHITLLGHETLNQSITQRIRDAHKSIIYILPETLSDDGSVGIKNIELNKSIEELFSDYFFHIKKYPINNELQLLFKEMLTVELEN